MGAELVDPAVVIGRFAGGDDELAQLARSRVAAASADGEAMALELAMELAQQEREAQQASVVYQLRRRDPFAAVGIDLAKYRPRKSDGERASAEQLAFFRKAGLPVGEVAALSQRQAEALREQLLERKAVGLCTPKQAKALVELGYDPRDLYYDQAQELLREAKAKRRASATDA